MSDASDSRNLDRSLVSGIAWTALLRWLSQLVSWVATLYGARLLAPADFGIVSMAMLAIGLARMAQEFGLDAILVQDRSIVGEARARLAGLMLMLGGALFVLYVLLAPLVAMFFAEPQVKWVVIALAFFFVFDAIQIVPYAQLQRELKFQRLAIVGFVQVLVTSAALIIAVRAEFGLWALVISKLAGEAAVTMLLLYWQPYAVAWPRDLAQLSAPLLQGWRVLASRIAWYGYTNADQTLIGRMLGKDALGAYSFATSLAALPQQEVGSIVTRVVPGIFSEVQHLPGELRRYFLLLTEFLTLLSFPMSVGLALSADLLVPLVLGDRWQSVVVPLQLLCVYSAFLSSQLLVSHVLSWTGQFRIYMWCSILTGVVMPLVLYMAIGHGIEGVAWAWVIAFPLTNAPAFTFAFRTIGISLRHWLVALAPAVVGSLAIAVAVIGVRAIMPAGWTPWMVVIAVISAGALVYPLTVWLLFPARLRAMVAFARSLRASSAPQA